MQPVKQRVGSHRARLRSAGLKQVQIWVPDPARPGFAEECRRQSLLVAGDPSEALELATLDAMVDEWLADEP